MGDVGRPARAAVTPAASTPAAAGTPAGLVIGLTGPMCAGKNRAAEILEKRGFAVVDADRVAHQALIDVQDAVIAAFADTARRQGLTLLSADATVNRRALGSLLFSDPALLARHEAIIYPRINELLDAFIDAHRSQGVVINAPLLHKSPVLARCSFVIFIDAWAPVRFYRALERDKLPLKQIFARFSAQKHLFAQYCEKNVDIQKVYNRGSIRALERKLVTLLASREY